jgi:two-component system, chemotaxis family, protein-glutamate methylesterase/glutaminase
MIRVLVVEDSATAREFLLQILSSDPVIEVVGTAATGEEAIEAVESTRPDLITMDVHMPRMNGFDATRRIMETNPTPIVIVSGAADATDTAKAFRAIESGAVAVLRKPSGFSSPDHELTSAELIRAVKVMSEVKVIRRWPRYRSVDLAPLPVVSMPTEFPFQPVQRQIRIAAIGASTGGPPVLQTILAGLPRSFLVPVLIVQHMAAGFTQGFVDWLAQTSSLPIHIAMHGELVLPGHAYVAPDGLQMTVSADGRIQLKADEPENGLRPSVACLFRSVAKAYGHAAVGVLLTGMGKDGAAELKLMKERGAVTIAQDQETAVVHGMPGEAIRLGGATYVLPPDKIRQALTSLTMTTARNNGRSITDEREGLSGTEGRFLGRELSGR